MMKKYALYILPALFAALLIAAAGTVLLRGDDPSVIKTATHIKAPNSDIQGPAVVNFFASWCVPCEAEHPAVTELAKHTAVYGINYMDSTEKAAAFLARLGNPYKDIKYDTEGQMGVEWGLIGVPTSFVIDENNMIIYRHDAPLTPAIINNDILPLLGNTK
jgi:cytochrome c biogenesis protein CcmG/thiol:disulfide interchange protein DsbE